MTTDTSGRAYVEKAGVVPMALSVEEAFPLFNAEGEGRWVAGWNPDFLRPEEPKVGQGVVFQTVQPDVGTATWIQTRHEPAAALASFVFIVPDHRAVMVDVDVTPDGEGRSLASVTYRMTSLSSDADDFVRAFAEGFTDMMAHWAEAIERHIVEGVPLGGD